ISGSSRVGAPTPALAISRSTEPNRPATARMAATACSRSAMSAAACSAVPPAARIVPASSARRSPRRANRPTFPPSAASCRARQWPIPVDAPVTTATRVVSVILAPLRATVPLAPSGRAGSLSGRSGRAARLHSARPAAELSWRVPGLASQALPCHDGRSRVRLQEEPMFRRLLALAVNAVILAGLTAAPPAPPEPTTHNVLVHYRILALRT